MAKLILRTPHWLAVLLSLGLAALSVPALHASDATDKNDEAKIRAQEEKEAAQETKAEDDLSMLQQTKIQTEFHGILTLTIDEKTTPTAGSIIGTFVTDKTDKLPGQTYTVKAESVNAFKALAPFDKKTVSIFGRLRNKGKYIVAIGLFQHSPGPIRVARGTRGGV